LEAICANLRHPNHHGGATLDEVAEFDSIWHEVAASRGACKWQRVPITSPPHLFP